jgi:hypothetical protein
MKIKSVKLNKSGKAMIQFKESLNNEYSFRSMEGFLGWRGVNLDEFSQILKTGKPLPSTDLMPLDFEVVEYGLGDSASEMSEEEIEDYVQSICSWYDGSLGSIRGGLNVTTDFDNARGYGDVVLAIGNVSSDYCDFSDSHRFIQSAKGCKVLGYFKDDKFYEAVSS